MNQPGLTRRQFLASSAFLILAATTHSVEPAAEKAEPIIDIHQHTNYHGRTDDQLIAHQRAMGVTQTILLPAGTPVNRHSTHDGKSNGLAAKCGGNETVLVLHKNHPKEFIFGANEVTDLPVARTEIEKYLKLGAVIIGEQKFGIDCDSAPIEMVAELAHEYRVPVLLHFQHETYNLHFERFHKILEKFPKVNFIGHAQTWWANIDKNHTDQSVLYPKTKVTPGGITDRWLAEYPNLYGDLSAGSGLNALTRDEDFTRGFFDRHQNKLLYGSDCADTIGRVPGCQGAQTIAAIRRLSSSKAIERKLLYENAKKMFRI
jgi:predicted TIM-barrel fold metal-dependent hydrolase